VKSTHTDKDDILPSFLESMTGLSRESGLLRIHASTAMPSTIGLQTIAPSEARYRIISVSE
jgi:hypothetical protein